jgi:hypothetical protein
MNVSISIREPSQGGAPEQFPPILRLDTFGDLIYIPQFHFQLLRLCRGGVGTVVANPDRQA